MSTPAEQFVKELKIELEDLWQHAESDAQRYERRLQRHEVRKHVCFGNVAVLRNEECCLRSFMRVLERLSTRDDMSFDELAETVKLRFNEQVTHCGFAPCTYLFAEQKVEKVRQRMKQRDRDKDGDRSPSFAGPASPTFGSK